MKRLPMIKGLTAAAMTALILLNIPACLSGCSLQKTEQKIPVKVLILPAFEVDEMEGDFPGEAQYYYEGYLAGGEEYTVRGCVDDTKMYLKDGVALCLLGEGKVSAALNTGAILSDGRFDFSDAYFLVTGCAGGAKGYSVMGDVSVITAVADYDLGHHADPREQVSKGDTTWYHDEEYDENSVVSLDPALTDRVFELAKDVRLETTGQTAAYLETMYPGEVWAQRQPRVLKGTAVTGDNFWKGAYDHQNALLITETYGCPDPYAVTDMEDIAVGLALKKAGMLDRLIILRDSVNMDVFGRGSSPESLWGGDADDELASESSEESIDIFAVAMKNNYTVGKIVIDAILQDAFLPDP